jgi:large subunit ribosomal protein L29
MKNDLIQNIKPEEFLTKLKEMKEEYFNLRFRHGVGQLENTASLSKIRKNIARLKTVIRAQQLSKN